MYTRWSYRSVLRGNIVKRDLLKFSWRECYIRKGVYSRGSLLFICSNAWLIWLITFLILWKIITHNTLCVLLFFLGNLKNLSGLNLAKNPLEFPPKDVIESGTKVRCLCIKEK